MIWIIVTISLCATVILLVLFAILCLLSAMVDRLKVIAGALSMIATALDERVPGEEHERLIFRHMADAIFNAIVNSTIHQRH